MRTTLTKKLTDLTLFNLLTVDTHSVNINILDNPTSKPYRLIPNNQTFFGLNGLYADVEKNSLTILSSTKKEKIDLYDLLRRLNANENSSLVLVEGFAGCGKSTLVQYILSYELKTFSYEYCFYNYDLEAQNDLIIHDKFGNRIKESSIFEAIKISFLEQFCKVVKENRNVLSEFSCLLEKCRGFQEFKRLYNDFYFTDTYSEVCKFIESDFEKNENTIYKNLKDQLAQIKGSFELLALDYLLRLAMYKSGLIEKLYICYDNLDAIEDAEDLKQFNDSLIRFRELIDSFIISLQYSNYFGRLNKPHFIILATFRKITAIVAQVANTLYKEVNVDYLAGNENNRYIYYIDATSAYSYRKIVAKRTLYFENYYSNLPMIISNSWKKNIMTQLAAWNSLNQKLQIMKDRYSCLWNKNYRTCSLIADNLFTNSKYDFMNCVKFISHSGVNDGYDTERDSDGNNILSTYYGASAILLSCVCKVFNDYKIWDNKLCLTSLRESNPSHTRVSFSRILLTYIYNSNEPVSIRDMYFTFCVNGLFSYKQLCRILSKMLARNVDGVWRRPIYYYDEFIMSESAEGIERALVEACKEIEETGTTIHNYRFQICESGEAYVERLMQEFEFFSNRLSNDHKALYLYTNLQDIKDILDSVYSAVSCCCTSMIKFRQKYIELNGVTSNEYLSLPIHPTTNRSKSPQLHTERTIFSHIAYLNDVRRYFLDPNVTKSLEKRRAYNLLFVDYIDKYLSLYSDKIKPITRKREWVYNELKDIVNDIRLASKFNGRLKTQFKSVSLTKKNR